MPHFMQQILFEGGNDLNTFERAQELKEELLGWRRHIHAHPEAGPAQPETVEFVMRTLESFGLMPQKLGGGVVALVEGEKPGKTILLRADMDALYMDDESGLPFASQVPGMNHACGHDMHTAMLLGAAKILSERRNEICGTVKLCFQPAEELGSGAKQMLAAGLMEDPKVDVALGLHMAVAANDPAGTLAFSPGVTLVANDMFTITVHGMGSHGARPETSVDPINIICHIHQLLQSINSREVSCKETFVLSICHIGGGATANSIPDEAFLRGTLRTFGGETREFIKRRIVEIAEQTASMMRGSAEVKFDIELAPVINDPVLTQEMEGYMREIFPAEKIAPMPTRMGAEDFSYISARVPSLFVFLSGGSREEGYTVGTHNPKVLFSETGLPVGAATTAHCAIRWLKDHA